MNEDDRLLQQTMYGPPRRDPAPHQIEASHARKKRMVELKERLLQIDGRCEVLKLNKQSASSQMTEVAKKVAVARQVVNHVIFDLFSMTSFFLIYIFF